MQITFISDTHGKHEELTKDLSGGPILIHCGDVSNRGASWEIRDFLEWFTKLPYTHKIFIAGNHDFHFEKPITKNEVLIPNNIHYLQDNHVIIEGIKIYGTPWQPWFFDWAFNLPRNGKEIKEKCDQIPLDTDILITHAPPKGILDRVIRGYEHVGCEILRNRILDVKPKINCFGHIHESYGLEIINDITYVNASSLDHRYDYVNKPIVIDYNVKQNK